MLVSHAPASARPMTASASPALKGAVTVPGDKSISHRALMFSLLTVGRTDITGLLEGEDVLNTAKVCGLLGARVERLGAGHWQVDGVGIGGLHTPTEALDFGNAGTGCRLMMGLVGGHPITATFDGDASLRKRPMRRILDPLSLCGMLVVSQAEGGRLPVTLRGPEVALPVTYTSPVASAQVKSAILLAGLNAPGETTVIEKEATRDHTERMLMHFGADVMVTGEGEHGRRITLKGQPELKPKPVVVPGDPSSAAFPLVAALITPGSDVLIRNVMLNELRIGLITSLLEMGALITIQNRRIESGEEVGDIRARYSTLTGIDVPASRAPAMIDEYPVLAVAASFAKGTTIMRGLNELRVKESDRLAAVSDGLRANGVTHHIDGDDLIVEGAAKAAGGGLVATHMDHRIAMSFLVMGLASDKPVSVDDTAFIATSFPDFVPMMQGLGAQFS